MYCVLCTVSHAESRGQPPPSNLNDIHHKPLDTSRPQKNQSCQFHLSTKQSFPSTLRDLLLVGDSLRRVALPQVIPTPASMVTKPPGVSPCIMETPTVNQLLITLITLIIPPWYLIRLNTHLITILLPPLLLQWDIPAQSTRTGDQASTNSYSKFIRRSCISAGNG